MGSQDPVAAKATLYSPFPKSEIFVGAVLTIPTEKLF